MKRAGAYLGALALLFLIAVAGRAHAGTTVTVAVPPGTTSVTITNYSGSENLSTGVTTWTPISTTTQTIPSNVASITYDATNVQGVGFTFYSAPGFLTGASPIYSGGVSVSIVIPVGQIPPRMQN